MRVLPFLALTAGLLAAPLPSQAGAAAAPEFVTPVLMPRSVASPPEPARPHIPEPSTLLLVGTGLLGVAVTARLRRRRREG